MKTRRWGKGDFASATITPILTVSTEQETGEMIVATPFILMMIMPAVVASPAAVMQERIEKAQNLGFPGGG